MYPNFHNYSKEKISYTFRCISPGLTLRKKNKLVRKKQIFQMKIVSYNYRKAKNFLYLSENYFLINTQKCLNTEAVKGVLKFTGKHLHWSFFLIRFESYLLTSTRVFYCDFCNTFKNPFG